MSFASTRNSRALSTPTPQKLNAADAYSLALDYNNRAADSSSQRMLNTLRQGQDIFGESYERRVGADAPTRNAQVAQSMIGAGSNVQSSALSSEGSRLSGEAAILDALGRVDPGAARLRARQSTGQYGVADVTPGGAINRESVAQPVPFGEGRTFGGGGSGGGGGRSAGSTSQSFGEGAAAPSGYSTNVWGQRSLYDTSGVADWQNRQNQVLNQSINKERQLSAIRTQEESARGAAQNAHNIDIMNRQASIDAQTRAQEGQRASESGRSQRESNERIAAMNAQSQALGGLFGSIGQRQQSNFWG